MTRQLRETIESAGIRLGGVVRMDADGCINERVLVRQPDAGFQVGWTFAGADGQHPFDSGCASALDGGLTIVVELLIVEMAMRIDQLHFNRAPTGMSSRKAASTGLPPSTEAATIMPFEVRPRSLRGARLATITTFRPINCSGG